MKKLPVELKPVSYFKDAEGVVASPTVKGNFPGVIMIHEWWGLNPSVKGAAVKLAEEGYVVMAVDLFHNKVATDMDTAKSYVMGLNQDEALSNLKSAVAFLKTKYNVPKIATLGWCFGGGQSLQIALNSNNIHATVIYYGNLVTDRSRLSKIRWPVLGIFGDKDEVIPLDAIHEFRQTLNDLRITNEIYIYPGLGHAFANPTGRNFAQKETADAWSKTLQFLESTLKQ
jgi:carboxymethylenebutenolidase